MAEAEQVLVAKTTAAAQQVSVAEEECPAIWRDEVGETAEKPRLLLPDSA